MTHHAKVAAIGTGTSRIKSLASEASASASPENAAAIDMVMKMNGIGAMIQKRTAQVATMR